MYKRITRFSMITALALSALFSVRAQQDDQGEQAPQRTRPSVQYAAGKSALKIPLELDNNIIILRVRVNGSKPLKFLFDTGASISVIDPILATELGLKTRGQARGTATGGPITASFIQGVSFDVEGVKVSNQLIAAIDFGRAGACFEFDGIIGYDFINRFVVEIDYPNKVMNLFDPGSYQYAGKGEVIPISLAHGTPLANTRFLFKGRQPVDARLEIDTGGDGTFIINSPIARKNDLVSAFPKSIAGANVGAGGEQDLIFGRVNAVSLGRLVINDAIVALSQDTDGAGASSENDGTVGAEVLRRYKVIFDYSRKRMILEPNKGLGDPYEVGMSGFTLGTDEKDCKALLIDRVAENSPASAAGLLPGDVITAIGSRSAGDIPSDEVEKIFIADGKEMALTIRRGAEILQKKIRLKRVI